MKAYEWFRMRVQPFGWLCGVMAAVLVLAPVAAGCGLIFKGTTDTVPVMSNPVGAQVFVDGMYAGVTPLQVSLDGERDHMVTFRAPGYQDFTVPVTMRIGAGYLVLDILFTGLLGIVVDAVTGAWNVARPGTIAVNLAPAQQQQIMIVEQPSAPTQPAQPAQPPPGYIPAQ